MEAVLSANEQQSMVSSFLEVAQGQTAETARQFLQATSWKLEEALQLFLIGNDVVQLPPPPSLHTPPLENVVAHSVAQHQSLSEPRKDAAATAASESIGLNDAEEVRPPLPVIRETLYDDAMLYGASRVGHRSQEPSSLVAFRNFEEEMRQPGVWESSEQGAASTAETARDNLASLYRPPFHLMFNGPFDKASCISIGTGFPTDATVVEFCDDVACCTLA